MANVSFHIGTSNPVVLSQITKDGIYINRANGGIHYAVGNTGDTLVSIADHVSITRNLTSGTKVGTITINGTATDLYCQTNTDTKCSYTSSSTNAEYPLLFKSSTSTTTTAGTPYFDTGITVNPSSNKITAALFKGDLVLTSVDCYKGCSIPSGFYVAYGYSGSQNAYNHTFCGYISSSGDQTIRGTGSTTSGIVLFTVSSGVVQLSLAPDPSTMGPFNSGCYLYRFGV